MSDHKEIEPYRREYRQRNEYERRNEQYYPTSKGSSDVIQNYNLQDRQSQEKYGNEDLKYNDSQPERVLKQGGFGYERENSHKRQERMPYHFNHRGHSIENSRSPPREDWRSGGSSYSPHRENVHHNK